MSLQLQWDRLCETYEQRDWDAFDSLLPQVKEQLAAGRTPIISPAVSEHFNLAMARAGVEFMTSHFTKTREWPMVAERPDDTFSQ